MQSIAQSIRELEQRLARIENDTVEEGVGTALAQMFKTPGNQTPDTTGGGSQANRAGASGGAVGNGGPLTIDLFNQLASLSTEDKEQAMEMLMKAFNSRSGGYHKGGLNPKLQAVVDAVEGSRSAPPGGPEGRLAPMPATGGAPMRDPKQGSSNVKGM